MTNAEQLRERPRILYRYFSPERIDVLESMELRFSRPSEFNDTFDTHYLVPRDQSTKRSLERVRLRAKLGILCLTEQSNNHLMWVNYACNHTGFVIGFDANAPFFAEDGRRLDHVQYRKLPDVVAAGGVDACFRKSDVWKYEREWRCVREFKKSEPRNVCVDSDVIREIIFGFHMEAWQIARILSATTAYEMNPTFMMSKASKKSWTFDNERADFCLCEICDGRGYTMTEMMD